MRNLSVRRALIGMDNSYMTMPSSIDIPSAPQRSGDPLDRLVMRLSAFERLDPEEAAGLRRIVRRGALLPAYDDVLKDSGRDVTVLLSGLACQFKLMGNGRRQITGLIVPGDICNYGFLTGNAAPGQFMTLSPSQIGRIAVASFTRLCESNPRIMRAALRGAATDSAITQERVMSLGQRTAVERVSHLLCEMRGRLDVVGLVGPGNTYDFHITQAELGETLGLSTVHVNRTLQLLRREGHITMRQGKVSIDNLPGLMAVAGFDPSYLQPPAVVPTPRAVVE